MTCEPYCDECGGNLGHPANGDWTCAKCKAERLRKSRKERIRKDEFDPYNPEHFRLQTRAGGAWRAGQRFEDAGEMGAERLVMIHLGDHDPSGIDMTRDNADRLQLYSRGADIDVRRIALNMDQVRQYDPPENPAKVTDTRAKDYIRNYGHSSWELDALEPSILERLIHSEIETLIDFETWHETEAEQEERREALKSLHDRFDDIKEFLATT